jgi:8-oxo-dGTP pyrophosphatase MutT (NUDIX family)
VLFEAALGAVEVALAKPLPGPGAHERMAPRPRREWPAGFDRATIRDAAALLLLFPVDGRAHIVLTVRADTLDRHGGQVSLPGGVIDPDETAEQAAVREAHEEIGLAYAGVRTLGALTPLDIPVSGFRLHPIVGAVLNRPAFTPSRHEVARVLEIDLDRLADPAVLTTRDAESAGRRLTLPAYTLDGVEVWGATAMVLAEFLSLILPS